MDILYLNHFLGVVLSKIEVYYGNEMVENSNPTGGDHGIENNGHRLPIIGSAEFTTSVKKLAEVSGKSIEQVVQDILLGGTELQEKSVFEHCDVVLVKFTDGKVCGMRGFKNKNSHDSPKA